MTELRDWIEQRLSGLGWRYADLARRAELSPMALSRSLAGKRHLNQGEVERIADALGSDPKELAAIARGAGHGVAAAEAERAIVSALKAAGLKVAIPRAMAEAHADFIVEGFGAPVAVTLKVGGKRLERPQVAMPPVPIYGRSGPDLGCVTLGESSGLVPRPPLLAGVGDAYAVVVQDDSLAPRFGVGDTLFAHPGLPARIGDDAVVTVSRDGGARHAVIGRLTERGADGVRLSRPSGEVVVDHVTAIHPVVMVQLAR